MVDNTRLPTKHQVVVFTGMGNGRVGGMVIHTALAVENTRHVTRTVQTENTLIPPTPAPTRRRRREIQQMNNEG